MNRGRGGGGHKHQGHHQVEKPKQFKKSLKRLLSYLHPQRFNITLVVIATILGTVFSVISPKLLGDATSSLFDSVTKGLPVDFAFLGKILIGLGALYLSTAVFGFFQQFIMATVAQKTSAKIRGEVFEKLTRLPLKYFDKHPYGDILSRAVNDVDSINNSLQQAITQIVSSIITVVGIVAMMFYISPWLALVVLLTLPLSVVIIQMVVKRSQKYFVGQQARLGDVNGHIEEMYSGHQVVKAYGYEQQSIASFNEMNDELYEASRKAQFMSGIMMPLMMFVNNLSYVFVSLVGGFLVISGSIRVGDVQAFIQYTQQLGQPMSQIAGLSTMLQTAIAAAERVFDLLDEEEELQQQATYNKLEKLQGRLHFDHISFGYDPEKPVIRNLNLEVDEGQTIAIVGPTGAGKTTMINLLMRFYEPSSGRILLDGIDYNQMSREQVRSRFAMVIQDTWLFQGTIRDNIAYGKEGATEEEIVHAAKSAFADDFIRTLPDGYNTLLGEDASNISQGQRQLITIARALLSNPLILILDEATSSVDTRTEMNIQRAMHVLMKDRTSFVIAHRLSTIRDADLILVMNHGEIIEQGTHEQLMAQHGFYADLHNSQFTDHVTEEEYEHTKQPMMT
ncbi:ABC transporter ATP-binding protein [Paenibacillus yanchengensis]|uniref:ABC transporter ATP-binding protein n=1 Tax=Paenibacillus yanchengensis TaxID=2035833 RepID=A0ABW4YNN0_9BACL